jgi:hypothetical protein
MEKVKGMIDEGAYFIEILVDFEIYKSQTPEVF